MLIRPFRLSLILLAAIIAPALADADSGSSEPVEDSEQPDRANIDNQTSESRPSVGPAGPVIFLGQGPCDGGSALDELCQRIRDILQDLYCAWDGSGGGEGEGYSPVIVNPGRVAVGVAHNISTNRQIGGYSDYGGIRFLC